MFEGIAFETFRAEQTSSKLMSHEEEQQFSMRDIRAYLERVAAALPSGYEEIAISIGKLVADDAEFATAYADIEKLEQWLKMLEGKVIAIACTLQSKEEALQCSRELDRLLRPYRGRMTADQLADLGEKFRERLLLESRGLPRLSLVYRR
jgi:hypothetical protein